jgi:GMP synthase (glutamine-hydrolysing)
MSKPVLILRHVPHESAGTVENALRQADLTFQYLDLFSQCPSKLDMSEYAGLVVLGGPMNVNEVKKHPFLAVEIDWIRQALDKCIPLLGICLGSQLLAKALGAKVYPNGVKEIGWYELELTPAAAQDRLFADCGPKITVFQWHGDTFDLPTGAIHLAQSPLCRHQAFRFGPSAYGLQFHIEMTADMVEDWLDESGNSDELASLDYIDPGLIREKIPRKLPALQAMAATILGRFAEGVDGGG